MTPAEVFDAFSKVSVVLGIPGVVIYLVRDRRRTRAMDRQAETAADVDEQEAPLKVKTTSVVTLESEIAALTRTFERDRKLTNETIEWLRGQLQAERKDSAAKDRLIKELQEKVKGLQARVQDLSVELTRVSDDLAMLHGEQQH